MALPFRDAYVACFGGKSEDFSQEALKQCLYAHARVIWPFLELAGGPPILSAQAFMDLIADTRTKEDLMDAIDVYRDEVRPYSGFLARRMYLRISVERLLALHHFVRAEEQKRAIQATAKYLFSSSTYSGSTVS